ncbi:cory-CC-star protein [Helicobacter kayseriensis]|uniref:cory-CC-star protein n=1 Tax=Helicobacter kayseriensis TaxID=2905877 RepID=UPI001E37E946|nr:cory-CC-star protein [Helicobacter kayseriensis]MCE3047347.1 DNA helicase [Helicobacter kayseriensis]MCE3048718.1 DNA helicase [Helicobacter kayseriensis]
MRNIYSPISKFLKDYYEVGYKRALKKEQEEIEALLMLLAFSEMMGIANPYEFHMLELIPDLMPKFHQWHKKIGFEKSPFDFFPCACC